jgi:hypothetical protein
VPAILGVSHSPLMKRGHGVGEVASDMGRREERARARTELG